MRDDEFPPSPAATPAALGDASAALPPHRRPETALSEHRSRHGDAAPVWVFGYASLIWRPEFDAVERRPARVTGWHRCLCMLSRVNRGTADRPGLVFALMSGGACNGFVYRLPPHDLNQQFQRLWAREMPLGVYDPRWLRVQTPRGEVAALAFTLSRRSPQWTGPIADARMIEILRHARGRYGSTLDYLVQTAQALREHGVCDREIERLVRLAHRHGLCAALS